MRKSRLTDKQIIEMCEKVKNYNLSISEAADFYGISKSHVSKIVNGQSVRYVQREVVDTSKYARKVTIPKAERILDLKRAGLFIKDIAPIVGLSIGSVRFVISGVRYPHLDRTGIKQIHHKTKRDYDHQRVDKEIAREICKKVEQGRRQCDVAAEYSLSRSYVCKLVHGRIFEDVYIKGKHYRTMPKRKANSKPKTVVERKINWRAKRKGMIYNEYGMLVPIE